MTTPTHPDPMAGKLPELPKAVAWRSDAQFWQSIDHCLTPAYGPIQYAYTADQMRAMYAQGKADAIASSEPENLCDDPKCQCRNPPTAATHPAPEQPGKGEAVAMEWRWVDEKGRAMTEWNSGEPPPFLGVSDAKGTMRVEARLATPQPSDPAEVDEYSQGICGDGAAILKNGVMLTIDEIVAELNRLTTPPSPGAETQGVDDALIDDLEYLEEVEFKAECCNSDFPINMLRRVVRQAIAALQPAAQRGE